MNRQISQPAGKAGIDPDKITADFPTVTMLMPPEATSSAKRIAVKSAA